MEEKRERIEQREERKGKEVGGRQTCLSYHEKSLDGKAGCWTFGDVIDDLNKKER